MSRQNKKKDEKEEPGLGALLATGAAVVSGAALLYGAFKLWETLVEPASSSSQGASAGPEQKKCGDSDSDGESYYDSRATLSPDPARGVMLSGAAAAATSSHCAEKSLCNHLMDYYESYVEIPPNEMKEAQRVMKDLKILASRHIAGFKTQSLPGRVEVVADFDGNFNELTVVRPDNFNITVCLEVCSDDWIVEEVSDLPGAMVIRGMAGHPSDFCNDEGYLLTDFLKTFHAALKNVADLCSEYDVEFTTSGNTVQLNITYADGQKKLTVNFQPVVAVANRRFTLTCLPASSWQGSAKFLGAIWSEMHDSEESQLFKLQGQRILLAIVYAVRRNFSSMFGILTLHHYKTIVLHMIEELPDDGDWAEDAISERFIDFLIQLERYLKEHRLPHFFDDRINLFDGVGTEALQNLGEFVTKAIGRNDLSALLVRDC